MLMSAGLGTRMLPFTRDLPKALTPLLGVPIAQFAWDQLEEAWVRKIVVNLHHLADSARKGFESLDRRAVTLEFSDERHALLGSAGGIAHALRRLREGPFFLMNADVLQDVDLVALSRAHARSGAKLTLALTRLPDASESYREIQVDPSGRIIGYGEKKRGALFYTGVGILDPSLVEPVSPDRPSDFVHEILDPAIRRGEAYAVEHSGLWMDLGSPELWARAHFDLMRVLESGNAPERIRSRVSQASIRVRDGFWMSRNFSTVPKGDFDQVYLGNVFYPGTSARGSVWYGNSTCVLSEPNRSWIAHGAHVQLLN